MNVITLSSRLKNSIFVFCLGLIAKPTTMFGMERLPMHVAHQHRGQCDTATFVGLLLLSAEVAELAEKIYFTAKKYTSPQLSGLRLCPACIKPSEPFAHQQALYSTRHQCSANLLFIIAEQQEQKRLARHSMSSGHMKRLNKVTTKRNNR